MPSPDQFFHTRRIGLCGSEYPPSKPFIAFCDEVGRSLARATNTMMAIAGRQSSDGHPSADRCFVDGFLAEMEGDDVSSRVETYRFRNEQKADRYFQIGSVVEVDGSTRDSRRFSMVHSVDALMGIGGSSATHQQLTFAFATETSALPVPCFGGSSAEIWSRHRDLIIKSLGITKATAKKWEQRPKTEAAARELARAMVRTFLDSLAKRCFVIMPFAGDYAPLIEFVIDPAVRTFGDEPLHLGQMEEPGNVGQQISQGVARADYAICVLDGMRPNVLYELGMAHALGKPVVLLWQRESDVIERAPFDISQEQRIEYDKIDKVLLKRLERAVQKVRG